MKFSGLVSIVQIPSPHLRSKASTRTLFISRPRRLSDTTNNASPSTPNSTAAADLSIVSRADIARGERPCGCSEILKSCLCRELTRTRDGVCDMCLYGIHVEEEGELFGDGYRANLPVVPKSRRWTPPSPSGIHKHRNSKSVDLRSPLSTVLEKNDDSMMRGLVVSSPRRLSRHRENFMRPVGIVFAHGAPLDFDEHGMF